LEIVFPDGTIIQLLPGEQVEPAKLKVAEKREIIVETERALRAVVREVYAARFRETAAHRIEEAPPERERESLAPLRARPAGSEPLSIVDYLYLSQLPPHVAMAMMIATYAISRVICPMIPASCISSRSCLAICVISCASTPVSSRVISRGVKGRDEFEEIGLAFEDVYEEIGIVRGQGAELVEERLFGLQLLAERAARVACHESLQSARARRDAMHRGIAVAPASPDAGNSM
jgi:hypothetical protein